jgi:hypothetical protein
MPGEESRHGWVPDIGCGTTIEQVVEAAFEYRGDVTVDKVDDTTVIGYLFNRNTTSAAPFAEVIASATGERVRLPYDHIKNIRFTGRDAAAGQSWEAWRRRRNADGGPE